MCGFVQETHVYRNVLYIQPLYRLMYANVIAHPPVWLKGFRGPSGWLEQQ